MFSTLFENFLLFSSNSKLSSANSFILDQSKILSFGKGLRCRLQKIFQFFSCLKLSFGVEILQRQRQCVANKSENAKLSTVSPFPVIYFVRQSASGLFNHGIIIG